MKLKALWYCTKSDLKLYKTRDGDYTTLKVSDKLFGYFGYEKLNGKIVATSDYELEEITYVYGVFLEYYHTKTLGFEELMNHSCILGNKLFKYLRHGDGVSKVGYAIHIKNLNIFDKPKELSDYYKTFERTIYRPNESLKRSCLTATPSNEMYFMDCCDVLTRAPQNMCYVYNKDGKKYVLISVRPEWLCLILNGLKDVELRRKVLKEMVL